MQWIVEPDDDRKFITIASFEKNTMENQRYYITPKAITDGSQVELKKTQPYKWRIQQDSDSASVLWLSFLRLAVLRMLIDCATRSIFLSGDNDKPGFALTTVTVADSKLDVRDS